MVRRGDGDPRKARRMTHAELVKRAVRWLYNTRKCQVVFAERSAWAGSGEAADAIGFRNSASILIECKTTRSDYLADAQKPWRQLPELALGAHRFFMTPKGLLLPYELPVKWGLLEVCGKVIRVRKQPQEFGRHWRRLSGELALLVSALNSNSVIKVEPRPNGGK